MSSNKLIRKIISKIQDQNLGISGKFGSYFKPRVQAQTTWMFFDRMEDRKKSNQNPAGWEDVLIQFNDESLARKKEV